MRPDGVPAPYDTEWSFRYDERTADVVAASLAVSLEPRPRVWPISGPLATEFNPFGHDPLPSGRAENLDPLGKSNRVEGETV